MNYKNFLNLSPHVQQSLLAGYSLPEFQFYKKFEILRDNKFSAETIAQIFGTNVVENSEALYDGMKLAHLIYFVFSADHESDLIKDIARYEEFAEILNNKYGNIIHPVTTPLCYLGIVGHCKGITGTFTAPAYDPVTKIEITVVGDRTAALDAYNQNMRKWYKKIVKLLA